MGIHQQGILGSFSGKVGPVVGSTWKGKNVIRAKPRKRKNKNQVASPQVVTQRARFSLANKFLNTMSELFGATFPECSQSMTSRNHAMSMIIRDAVTGTYPVLSIKYDAVQISRGSIGRPVGAAVSAATPGAIGFSWTDNSGIGTSSKPGDRAILVAYCPESDACVFTLDGGLRTAGQGTMDLDFFRRKDVHTWIAFMNAAGTKTSDSQYLGLVTVG